MTVKDLIEELSKYPADYEVKYLEDIDEFPIELNVDISYFEDKVHIRGVI